MEKILGFIGLVAGVICVIVGLVTGAWEMVGGAGITIAICCKVLENA